MIHLCHEAPSTGLRLAELFVGRAVGGRAVVAGAEITARDLCVRLGTGHYLARERFPADRTGLLREVLGVEHCSSIDRRAVEAVTADRDVVTAGGPAERVVCRRQLSICVAG